MEWLNRTECVIGKSGIDKLKKSTVAIFGIGGVGSYAAEAIVRAGVGNIVLVDGDNVSVTNINRQIHATTKTVGMSKVEAMRDRVLEINPKINVKIYNEFYMPGDLNNVLDKSYSYIIDAIDRIPSKIDLISKAKEYNIPIISAMGAGNKLEASMLEVADIFKTSVCPLAKVIRKELRKKGINKLKVVYSREEPIKPLDFETEELPSDKKNVLGSISFVPSAMGLIIAGEVVKDLIKGD